MPQPVPDISPKELIQLRDNRYGRTSGIDLVTRGRVQGLGDEFFLACLDLHGPLPSDCGVDAYTG